MRGKERRDGCVIARMTDKELLEFDKKCEAAGMNKSEYIRSAINRSEVYPMVEIQKLTSQVLKLGNNVNQIARVLNSNPNSGIADCLQEIIGEFTEIKEGIWRIEVDICR